MGNTLSTNVLSNLKTQINNTNGKTPIFNIEYFEINNQIYLLKINYLKWKKSIIL